MVINTNIQAQQAANNLTSSQTRLAKSLARLSSGSKIIDPSDDAGGLAVSTRLDAQLKRLGAAKGNVGNAMSMLQTQDGYLNKVAKALNRMSELSIMAQDITKQSGDLKLYDKEFQTLSSYIADIGKKDFNGVSLFAGDTMPVTTDADPTSGNNFNMTAPGLGTLPQYNFAGLDITSTTTAIVSLDAVKIAISQLADDRATIGANQTRLNYTAEQLTVTRENLTAANSRIVDVDVAEEATEYARYQILLQAGTSMVAQANQLPQSALKLLNQ
jgi:flagellin